MVCKLASHGVTGLRTGMNLTKVEQVADREAVLQRGMAELEAQLASCRAELEAVRAHEQAVQQRASELAQAKACLELELMRLTAKVTENETRLQVAHDAAGIGTWDWDLATDGVVWSPRTFEVWRIPPPVDGHGVLPAEVILRAIHPDDQARVRAELGNAVSMGEAFRSEFRLSTLDGEECWIAGLGRHVVPVPGERPQAGWSA